MARVCTITDTVRQIYAERRAGTFLRLLGFDSEVTEYSYNDVIDHGRRWATFYGDRGLGPGQHVVVILPHSLDLYGAYIGALVAGMIPAMFAFPSPKLSLAEYGATIGTLLENASPDIIVTYPELVQQLGGVLTPARMMAVTAVPEVVPSVPSEWNTHDTTENSTAFLQYSSGTTGSKKGVAITHRALLWQIDAYSRAIDLQRSDLIASWLPLYHDMGLICCFFLPLLTGTPVVAMSPFDWVRRPVMLLEAVTKYRATLCWLPNFAYSFLAHNTSDHDLDRLDLRSVRGFVNCSEPITAESHDRFLQRFAGCGFSPSAFAASYAMAESTFAITSGGFSAPLKVDIVDGDELAVSRRAVPAPADNPNLRRLVSSGVLLPESDLDIVAEDGALLPDRCIGEIAVRSPSMLARYHRNVVATESAIRGGRFFTGDLAYRADGHLFVCGRTKDLIIVAGKNIFPQDIEDAANLIEGVIPGRVAAFGVADPQMGTERLIVIAETAPMHLENELITVRAIADTVARITNGVTADVRLVEPRWLLKSTSGKISRTLVRERYLKLIRGSTCIVQARERTCPQVDIAKTSLKYTIREMVRCIGRLRTAAGRDISPTTRILECGLLDSLAFAELVCEVRNTFGIQIPSYALDSKWFETPIHVCALLRSLGDPNSTLQPKTEIDGTYDDYISLGFNCEPGLQFRRAGYDVGHFFRFTFAPLAAVVRLIRADFAEVFQRENLLPRTPTLTLDRRYGAMFHTKVPTTVDPSTGHLMFISGDELEQGLQSTRTLIYELIDRWRGLTRSDRRVLYVLKMEEGKKRDDVLELLSLLRGSYPSHQFTLLCLQPEKFREPDWKIPGVVNRYVAHYAPIDWAHDADVAGWNRIFAEFPLGGPRAMAAVASPISGALDQIFQELVENACGSMQRNDWEAVRENLEIAVEVRPDQPQVLQALGGALYRLGKCDAAQRAYENALHLDPSNFQLGLDLAAVRSRLAHEEKVCSRPDTAPGEGVAVVL